MLILYFESRTFGVIISWSEVIGLGHYFACDRPVGWNWVKIWWVSRVWPGYGKWAHGHVWFVFVHESHSLLYPIKDF